jgi:MFS family permease
LPSIINAIQPVKNRQQPQGKPMIDLKATSRRITTTLFLAQSFTSAGTIAAAAVLSIVAVEASGQEAMAGVPSAVNNLAAAPAAFLFGLLWERIGRRWGLTLGLVLGMLGLAVAMVAVQAGLFGLLLIGIGGMGFGRAAMQLSRFIAADVSPPESRGRALSIVVFGGTVGAIVGPLLAAPSGRWALALGLEEFAGPFAVATILFLLASLLIPVGFNREPGEIAREVDKRYPEAEETIGRSRPLGEIVRQLPVIVAMASIVIAQMVMVMVMGITSVHMHHLSHQLGAISVVFSAHTMGMFAFSIFTGQLADRWGRIPVILSGIVLLMASFILAPLYPTALMLGIALYMLGWNLCFVAGSALLSDQLSTGERARTQGFNDLLVGAASALGSLASGLIFARWGYGVLNAIGGLLTLIPLTLMVFWLMRRRGEAQVLQLAGD